MPRQRHPYVHKDISLLAKFVKDSLAELPTSPGHVQILNILAQATKRQNYQTWLKESKDLLAEVECLRAEGEAQKKQPVGDRSLDGSDKGVGRVMINREMYPKLFEIADQIKAELEEDV